MDIRPPQGSEIETRRDSDGVTILIPPPRLPESGFAAVLFSLVWLGLWAVGWQAAYADIMHGKGGWFVAVWLANWTIGGVWVAWFVSRLLRRPDRERLTLGPSGLAYDSGRPRPRVRFLSFRDEWMEPWERRWAEIFPKRVRAEVSKASLRSARLLTDQSGAHLVVDNDGRPTEIARYATDAEREWILRVVQTLSGLQDSEPAGS